MMFTSRLAIALALLAAFALPARAQDGTAPLTALLARGANPEGPFARRGFASADSVVQRAREQLGRRYRFAAASPDLGFDCSGLVKYVLRSVGVDLPHNAAQISREGVRVDTDSADLRPGDLLLFGRGSNPRISHIGIYVGDGRMIHASTSQRRVVEARIPAKGSSLKLRTVRRVLRDSTTVRSGSE